jgi:hypothetical protein
MLRKGFEPAIAVFERERTFHALDQAATLIRVKNLYTSESQQIGHSWIYNVKHMILES